MSLRCYINYMINLSLIDVLFCTMCITSANNSVQLTHTLFCCFLFSTELNLLRLILLMLSSLSFHTALPDKMACVQIARTLKAPRSIITSAAFANVPPVSIISSTKITFLPFTSPINSMVSITLAVFFVCNRLQHLRF